MIEKKIDNIDLTNVNDKPEFDFSAFFELEPNKNTPDFVEFLTWFIGYAEGNVCIFTAKKYAKSYQTFLQFWSRNSNFLKYVQKKLEMGTVFKAKVKRSYISYIYQISDKENINKLMRMFNGNFQLNKNYQQIQKWYLTSDNHAKPKTKITILPQTNKISLINGWLSGFIDAEACFSAVLYKSKTNKSGYALKLACTITQQNEFLVLENIRKVFNSKGKITKYLYGNNNFVITLQSRICLAILINYLERFPLKTESKKLSFENWKKLLPYAQQKILYKIVHDEKTFETLKKQIKKTNAHSINSPYYKKDLNKEELKINK